ncbi:MAG: hypothetical protein AAF633_12490 [Chloroflexota bacterium]
MPRSNSFLSFLSSFLHHNRYLFIALLLAVVAAWPLISGNGLLNTRGGGDSPFLIERLHQLEQALLDGHFPVRWMPDANYGYGYPFFNFYAPLAFYIAVLFRFVGFSVVGAIQMSQLIAFLLAAYGMYRLALRWFRSEPIALLASVAYTVAPFHLVNVYVRGDSIAEFWAMALYPIVILTLDQTLDAKPTKEEKPFSAFIPKPLSFNFSPSSFSISYAFLVLSHNISAMIFSPFVLLYALIKIAGRRQAWGQESLRFVMALFWGLLLSAWFWLPAIGEQGLTQLSEITAGYFDYNYQNGYHFRSTDLVQSTFFYDPNVSGGSAFRMGLVQAVLVGTGTLYAVYLLLGTVGRDRQTINNQRDPDSIPPSVIPSPDTGHRTPDPPHHPTSPPPYLPIPFLRTGLIISTFMLSPWSRLLWDTLPLLPYTQFPWRFLSIQAFFGAGLIGLLCNLFLQAGNRWPMSGFQNTELGNRKPESGHRLLFTVYSSLLLLLLLASSLGNLINPTYLPIAEEEISGLSIAQYEWFTRNIGTTISAEYLSPQMKPRPVTSAWLEQNERDRIIVAEGEATGEILQRATAGQQWLFDVESTAATVVLPTMFWEGWKLYVNDSPTALSAAQNSGLIQFNLPQGEHQVELRLTRTPLRLWGELLSLVTCLFLVSLAFSTRRFDLKLFKPVVLIAVVALLAMGLAAFVSPPLPDDELLTWDFGLMGYLHRADRIVYGHGAELHGYTYSSEVVSTCGSLAIDLAWENPPPGDVRDVTLNLTTPAQNFFSDVPPLLIQAQPLTAEGGSYQFEIPADTPLGLTVPLLSLSDRNRPRTLNGDKRGFIFLKPLRVIDGCQVESSPVGRGLELIDPADVSQPLNDPTVLQVGLTWLTHRPLSENYAVSLRLTDLTGREIHAAQRDTQPGFGYRPTSLWPVGQPVHDRLNIQLPDEMPFDPPYILLARLYDLTSGDVVLSRRLGELSGPLSQLAFTPHQPRNDWPAEAAGLRDVNVIFGEDGEAIIGLVGYQLIQNESNLDLTLYWRAEAAPPADYSHFVHLLDPKTGLPSAQHDGQPANNTYPTGQWVPGEIVADRLILPLEGVAPGTYPLSVGLYENDGDVFPRLSTSEDDALELERIVIN